MPLHPSSWIWLVARADLVTLAFWDQTYRDNDLYRAILLDKMNVNVFDIPVL